MVSSPVPLCFPPRVMCHLYLMSAITADAVRNRRTIIATIGFAIGTANRSIREKSGEIRDQSPNTPPWFIVQISSRQSRFINFLWQIFRVLCGYVACKSDCQITRNIHGFIESVMTSRNAIARRQRETYFFVSRLYKFLNLHVAITRINFGTLYLI